MVAIKNSQTQFSKIKADIEYHVDQLKINDNEKKFTAIQYLLEYPSPSGFIAIMEYAVSIEDRKNRNRLICHLCENAESFDWYK